jgi:hypothetical protein
MAHARDCAICHRPFQPTSNRQQRCPTCMSAERPPQPEVVRRPASEGLVGFGKRMRASMAIGTPFENAWRSALSASNLNPDGRQALEATARHWKAAYENLSVVDRFGRDLGAAFGDLRR